jgi:hypothetical protein
MRFVMVMAALCAAVHGQEIEDLGVLTPYKGIMLERNSTRKDFSHFIVDLVSIAPSNHVALVLTNELLTITNLVQLPSGKITMGVIPVYTDGLKGEIALYVFDLRRGRPPRAKAHVVHLAGLELPGPTNVHQAMESRRKARPVSAPPPLPMQAGSTNASSFPGPLPNGKSTTYADHLDAEAESR